MQSDFYQWFYFRLTGGGRAGRRAADPQLRRRRLSARLGRIIAPACPSTARNGSGSTPAIEDGILTISVTPPANSVWFAYFAPYTMERHHDLVASVAAHPAVDHRSLGQTLDGQEMDYFRIGEGPLQVWLYARQHPGETMAEWWMEGALERLLDDADPVSRRLREQGDLPHRPEHESRTDRGAAICAPMRSAPTSTANGTSRPPERSPEVLCVRNEMDRTGVDFAMDVHGDEAIAANFLAGFEGIPSWTEGQQALFDRFSDALVAHLARFPDPTRAMRSRRPARPICRCRPPSSPSASARCR